MISILESIKASFALDFGLFVHLATLGYVLGFLFKNQLILRLVTLVATFSYIIYYLYYPEEPLWGAILGSSLIIIANLIGTIRLLFDRLPLSISPEYMQVFNRLEGLQPGEFRRLMKIGELANADQDLILTEDQKRPEYLYFVIEGNPQLIKGSDEFEICSNRFVGEVSFILDSVASATVKLPKGGSYVRWERAALAQVLEKSASMKQTFEALIGRDLATKVAISQPLTSTS